MDAHRRSDGSAFEADATGAVLAAAARELGAVSATPQLEAEVLLAFVTGKPRSSLLAFPERTLEPDVVSRFAASVARRAVGEPLAYLTGEREFYSLPLGVTADVLIPRPETELLVELTLAAIDGLEHATVLDVGTGSGAIALAVKYTRPDAQVTASDVSAAALDVASANAARLALDVRFVESQWFAAFGGQRFDVIVSNPPYVCSADVQGDLQLEPRLALDGGFDGLDAYRALLGAAAEHLAARHGALLLEHGHEQRAEITELALASGWRVVAAHDDLAGKARVLVLAGDAA